MKAESVFQLPRMTLSLSKSAGDHDSQLSFGSELACDLCTLYMYHQASGLGAASGRTGYFHHVSVHVQVCTQDFFLIRIYSPGHYPLREIMGINLRNIGPMNQPPRFAKTLEMDSCDACCQITGK